MANLWVVLHAPRLRNDSIIGIAKRGFEVGVPLSEVGMVQRQQVDAGNTAGMVLFVVGTVTGIIAIQGMKDLFQE